MGKPRKFIITYIGEPKSGKWWDSSDIGISNKDILYKVKTYG